MYGPAPLQQIVEMQMKVAETTLPYPLHFHTLTRHEVLVDNEDIRITAFPTTHRIECYGFLFEEKEGKRKLLIDKSAENEYSHFILFKSATWSGLYYATRTGNSKFRSHYCSTA